MDNSGTLVSMLSCDFVKADPVTYRGIDGTIRFEVKVETDNRKEAITVTRMEAISSKSKYSAINGKRCAGAKNIRGGLNPFWVFSVFDQPSHNLKADTKLDFVSKPLLMERNGNISRESQFLVLHLP
jgi:hypothetical protein